MKKILLSVAVMAMMTVAGSAYSFCGGQVKHINDCGGNVEAYNASCCPAGYRVHGIVYNDLKGEDAVNNVVAYCRKYKGDEYTIPNRDLLSGGKGHVTLACNSNEVMSALGCADQPKKDAADGCAVQCFNPTTKASRWVLPHGDIGHPTAIASVKLPNRIQGIGTKKEHHNTDRMDCATVSYKHQPIVK